MPHAPALLEFDRLTFAHPGRPLWADWSARWAPGLVLVQGDDGAGKTTALQLLAGVLTPGQGHVRCAGLDSVRDATAYRARCAWHDPRAPLPEHLAQAPASAWVQAQAAQYPDWDSAAWQRHVAGWALQPHLHKPFVAHSTGTQRKLWMAAALASGAPLTLIDEPTAGLDRPSLAYLSTALASLAAGARWVVVAHYERLPGVPWDAVVTLPTP